MCFISIDGQKIKLLFDVLFVYVPYIVPEIGRFYLYGGRPLVSILIMNSHKGIPSVNNGYITLSCMSVITFGF